MFHCKDCGYNAATLKDARKHAKEAGPVWRAERQTFVTHRLERVKPAT